MCAAGRRMLEPFHDSLAITVARGTARVLRGHRQRKEKRSKINQRLGTVSRADGDGKGVDERREDAWYRTHVN